MKINRQNPRHMGHVESSPRREFHSNTGLSKELEKSQMNSLTLYLKELQEQQKTDPRVSRRKEIVNIRRIKSHRD